MTISAIMILTFSGLMASLSWISWSYHDVLLWSRTPSPAWCMTCHRCRRRGKVFVCSDNHCRTDTSPRSWKSESKSESQMRFFKRDSFVLKIIVRETHSWAIFHNILENIAGGKIFQSYQIIRVAFQPFAFLVSKTDYHSSRTKSMALARFDMSFNL